MESQEEGLDHKRTVGKTTPITFQRGASTPIPCKIKQQDPLPYGRGDKCQETHMRAEERRRWAEVEVEVKAELTKSRSVGGGEKERADAR